MSDTDRQRLRLLARIHRQYQTITQTLDIAGLLLDFTRIAEPDRVLDEVVAEENAIEKLSGKRVNEDQLHLPYWAELWESSRGIGQWFVANFNRKSQIANRKSVLDLGCGMGLAGAVAARLGHRVLMADLEPAALMFARLNSLADRARVRTRRLDWRTQCLGENFDFILGADILYERKQWDFLEPFWRVHLRENGTVVLGEPGRQTGEMFIDWIRDRGWEMKQFQEIVPGRETPIRVFELTIESVSH